MEASVPLAPQANDDETTTSAATLAYNAVLDLIVTRSLPAGTALHEQRLAEMVGVSRTPLRQALHRLEGEGLVARHGSRRLVVTPITVRDYIEALHVRRLLESETAALAAGRIPEETNQRLRARIETLMSAQQPSPTEHWSLDDDIHEEIARASGNDLMVGLVRSLRRKTRMFNLKRMPNRFLPGCKEHLVILDAIASNDGSKAGKAMATHIDNVKISILECLAEF